MRERGSSLKIVLCLFFIFYIRLYKSGFFADFSGSPFLSLPHQHSLSFFFFSISGRPPTTSPYRFRRSDGFCLLCGGGFSASFIL